MDNLTQSPTEVQVYLDREIKHLHQWPAGWYTAKPTRLAVRAPRGGRVGRTGYRINEIGCLISMKEFKRLSAMGRVRVADGSISTDASAGVEV